MKFQTKALYNLLRLNYRNDPSIPCEPWQIEDLRPVGVDILFERLARLGVKIDNRSFSQFAKECDSPEELTNILLPDVEDGKRQDKIYLLIFEIWRKMIPEKQSLSIFCDELDFQIYQYEHHKIESDEWVQDSLANLMDILDEHVDNGAEPTEIFGSLIQYLAHDLEGFLYDYIFELIDVGNRSYAFELLDGFYPYMSELVWFDFLKAKLLSFEDIIASNEMIEKIVKEIKKEPNLDLQLEILRFMVEAGDRDLFVQLTKKTLAILQKEEDFLELLEIVAEYYRRLDLEEIEKKLQNILSRRQNKQRLDRINLKDPDVKEFKLILH